MRKTVILVHSMTTGAKDFPVEATIVSEHLAVHRHLREGHLWNVTHLPTGGIVYTFGSFTEARRAAKALANLPWHKLKTAHSRKALAELGPLVAAILSELASRKLAGTPSRA